MENASKALIIAGSILLSILIIALGMFIFSQSSSSSDLTQITETEVQTFNAKFEKYNQQQLGSNVLSLVNAIRANATANQRNSDRIPTIAYESTTVGAVAGTAPVGFVVPDGHRSVIATGDQDLSLGNALVTYVNALSNITNDVERSHRYTVNMQYNPNGLINVITINY